MIEKLMVALLWGIYLGVPLLVFCVFAWALLWALLNFGYETAEYEYQQQALDRGYAEHDSKTGEWRWKEFKRDEP